MEEQATVREPDDRHPASDVSQDERKLKWLLGNPYVRGDALERGDHRSQSEASDLIMSVRLRILLE
jgi:hypothetical protein